MTKLFKNMIGEISKRIYTPSTKKEKVLLQNKVDMSPLDIFYKKRLTGVGEQQGLRMDRQLRFPEDAWFSLINLEDAPRFVSFGDAIIKHAQGDGPKELIDNLGKLNSFYQRVGFTARYQPEDKTYGFKVLMAREEDVEKVENGLISPLFPEQEFYHIMVSISETNNMLSEDAPIGIRILKNSQSLIDKYPVFDTNYLPTSVGNVTLKAFCDFMRYRYQGETDTFFNTSPFHLYLTQSIVSLDNMEAHPNAINEKNDKIHLPDMI